MTRKGRVFTSVTLVALAITTLFACKPIAYYLQQVYKAYGKVLEAGSGIPLESVEVFLHPYQYSVLTNGLGDYGIELSEGTWTLDFVKDGYFNQSRTVTVSSSNPRVHVEDVVLTRSGGYKLSGTWVIPSGSIAPNGIYGYLKLVTSGGLSTGQALYWTRSSEFSSGGASYSIAGIAAGTYTVWAFVDVNGNAPNNASALPDSGDYFLEAGKQVTISGDQTLNLDWIYVGTWANPAYDSGGPGAKPVFAVNSVTFYTHTTDPAPSGTWSFIVTDDWISGGDHYFKMFLANFPMFSSGVGYALARVSNINTLELVLAPTDYPQSINPADQTYAIWYRQ
jgi:hypothetical protein